jgi:hypothetical protein
MSLSVDNENVKCACQEKKHHSENTASVYAPTSKKICKICSCLAIYAQYTVVILKYEYTTLRQQWTSCLNDAKSVLYIFTKNRNWQYEASHLICKSSVFILQIDINDRRLDINWYDLVHRPWHLTVSIGHYLEKDNATEDRSVSLRSLFNNNSAGNWYCRL